jgi:peroxiredoxin
MPEFEDRLRLSLVNRLAPEIAGVATFQGEASSLRELRGQVVVLEFWASFCGVCRFLGPRLDQWHRTYSPQGAEVVGITVDPPGVGLEVAARTGMSYTLASDTESKVSRTYLASQIPVVVIIDRQGVVRDAMVGYSEGRLQETEALIKKLLRRSP